MKRKDHERLLALFSIALVNHLPPDLSERIASNLDELGALAQRDGDTSAGTAARELARLMAETAAMTRKSRH